MGTEELCRRDGDAPLRQWQVVELHRHARHEEHQFLLLVKDTDIVDDDTVEESQIDATYLDFGTQRLAQQF